MKSNKEKIQFLKKRTPFELPGILACLRGKKEKRLINIGMSRVENLLEIDNFLKGQIKMKVAMKTLFSKAERFLIRNNKALVITSDDDQKSIKKKK